MNKLKVKEEGKRERKEQKTEIILILPGTNCDTANTYISSGEWQSDVNACVV